MVSSALPTLTLRVCELGGSWKLYSTSAAPAPFSDEWDPLLKEIKVWEGGFLTLLVMKSRASALSGMTTAFTLGLGGVPTFFESMTSGRRVREPQTLLLWAKAWCIEERCRR